MHQCTVVVCCKSVTQKMCNFGALWAKIAPFFLSLVTVTVWIKPSKCCCFCMMCDCQRCQWFTYGFQIYHLFVHIWLLIYFVFWLPLCTFFDYFRLIHTTYIYNCRVPNLQSRTQFVGCREKLRSTYQIHFVLPFLHVTQTLLAGSSLLKHGRGLEASGYCPPACTSSCGKDIIFDRYCKLHVLALSLDTHNGAKILIFSFSESMGKRIQRGVS